MKERPWPYVSVPLLTERVDPLSLRSYTDTELCREPLHAPTNNESLPFFPTTESLRSKQDDKKFPNYVSTFSSSHTPRSREAQAEPEPHILPTSGAH